MEYRVPTHEKPTYFNREAAIGALMGSIIPVPGLGALGFVAGGAIGSYLGKQRMEKELTEGKVFKEPTGITPLLSKEAALDGWIGKFGGIVAGLVIAAVVSASVPVAAAIVATGAIAGALAGAFHGADKAKVRMKREYAQAEYNSVSRSQGLTPQLELETGQGKSYAAQITAERRPAVTVTVQTGKGPGQSYTSNLTAEREQAAVRGNAIT